uniref:Putative secreted protein n=1 Tax=Anopheles marajoara TaxID=58244 RepID=A0A2M4CCN1_9DIPT
MGLLLLLMLLVSMRCERFHFAICNFSATRFHQAKEQRCRTPRECVNHFLSWSCPRGMESSTARTPQLCSHISHRQ